MQSRERWPKAFESAIRTTHESSDEEAHTVTAARVASLLALTEATTVAGSTTSGALAGDVTDLAALVALSTTSAVGTRGGASVGVVALAREMAGLAASVAGLLLLGSGALAAHVAVLTAVVAIPKTLAEQFHLQRIGKLWERGNPTRRGYRA